MEAARSARSGPTQSSCTSSRRRIRQCEVVDLGKNCDLWPVKHALITTIDSTFATPINCRPAEWGHRSGAAFWHEIFWRTCRHYVRHRHRTARFNRSNPPPAHDARLLHGSARDISAAARDQDSGRPGRAPERKKMRCGIAEFLSQHPKGNASALPAAEKKHPDYAVSEKKQNGGALAASWSFEVEGSGADACRVAESAESIYPWRQASAEWIRW